MPDSPTPSALPVSPADIRAAAARLAGVAVRTPLLESPLLNDRLGGRVLVKAEPLQLTGSFKFRGAYNKIAQIPAADRPCGVVAYSSGNHAQGVALAAAKMGLPATIVMPADAPAIKQANTAAYGARVVTYDRLSENREAIGAAIAAETGATLVKPYDDPDIIAGQGTVGLEIAEDLTARDIVPDEVLVCCGGGGLVAGTSLALRERFAGLSIRSVEPEGWDDTARSLAAGIRQAAPGGGAMICDALLAPTPGEITFAINRQTLAPGLVVGEAAVLTAMRWAVETLKLVVEPGGAVTLAALVAGLIPVEGRTIVLVASGGNVDPAVLARALTHTGT